MSAAPFDLVKSAPKFAGTTFNRLVYDSNFLQALKRKAEIQYEMLGEHRVPYKIDQVQSAQSVAEFEVSHKFFYPQLFLFWSHDQLLHIHVISFLITKRMHLLLPYMVLVTIMITMKKRHLYPSLTKSTCRLLLLTLVTTRSLTPAAIPKNAHHDQ